MEQTLLFSLVSMFSYFRRDAEYSLLSVTPFLLPFLLAAWTYFDMTTKCRNLQRQILSKFAKHAEFTARINLKYWADKPDSVVRCFSVVLWHWNKQNLTVNCRAFSEETVRSMIHYYESGEGKHRNPQPIFVDDPSSIFWNKEEPSIQYTMWVERTIDREGTPNSEIILRILFPNLTSPDRIAHHIDFLRREATRIQEESEHVQHVLVSKDQANQKEADEEESKGPNFMAYAFATTSSFANFFCEEADLVQHDLEHFLTSKQTYQHIGRPWTYTILNEGPPGVGKTKLVKAIAAYTGYTLIVINLSHIPNTQVLYEVFHTKILGGESIPHEKRLYYIPEVDTQIHELLQSRTKKKKTKLPIEKEIPVCKKPTLGEILNVLDGVPERHGHILVLDTNHIDDLDKALIRPGRVDRILRWKHMSQQSVRAYVENYYSCTIPKTVCFPDRIYSAAEIQSLASQHNTWKDLHAVLRDV